jgi:hypothetical protein
MSRLKDMTDTVPWWLECRNAGNPPPARITGQIAGYCASSKRRGSSQERGASECVRCYAQGRPGRANS